MSDGYQTASEQASSKYSKRASGLNETNSSQHQTSYHIEMSGISVNNGRLERDRSVGIYPLVRYFVAGASARSAAELCGVNRNTAILFFHKLREVIADNLAAEAPDLMAGEIEVDESYFGGARKGKRGRGAAGKTPVFGLLKRGGKVYAVTIPNARRETLLPIIENKIQPDSIVYTNSFQVYDVLDVSDFHHVRINHSQLFAEDRNHIYGIENFWNQAKRHLRRYNGIPKHHFHFYLKECEWRFNYRPTANLLKVLLQWIRI